MKLDVGDEVAVSLTGTFGIGFPEVKVNTDAINNLPGATNPAVPGGPANTAPVNSKWKVHKVNMGNKIR